MPSPLPGMNPYIESLELWSEFHSRMIVAIADALDDYLSRDYRVAVEKRVYLSDDGESVLVGIPDVSVTGVPQNPTPTATLTAIIQPLNIEIPIVQEVQERFLEIREVATGSVITKTSLVCLEAQGFNPERKNDSSDLSRFQYSLSRAIVTIFFVNRFTVFVRDALH